MSDIQAATADAIERFQRAMLDDLAQLALRSGSAALATHLKASIKQHGSAKLTAVTCAWSSRLRHSPPRPRQLITMSVSG